MEKEFGDLWAAGKNENYQLPHGVNSPAEIKQIQSRLGVTADGIWGEETQTAWDRMRGANTAATFTQSVINRGKTYNDTSNIDTPELQHQQTPVISQEYLDQQIRRTPFLKKADVYLQKNLSEQRMLLFDEELMSYAMGNCITLEDTNGNRKLLKKRYEAKIDPVAAMLDAFVAWKLNKEAFE